MESNNEPMPIGASVEYATPIAPAGSRYGALPAILLCAPGLLCWTLLAGLISGRLPNRVIDFVGTWLILPLVAVAVLTAISSIIFYIFLYRRRKPWFEILNLVINISGLLLLIGAIVLEALIPIRD